MRYLIFVAIVGNAFHLMLLAKAQIDRALMGKEMAQKLTEQSKRWFTEHNHPISISRKVLFGVGAAIHGIYAFPLETFVISLITFTTLVMLISI